MSVHKLISMAAALAASAVSAVPGAVPAHASDALVDPAAVVSSVTSVLATDLGRTEPAGAPSAGAKPQADTDRPRSGEAIASLAIDRISLRARVLEGVSEHVLQRGVGHYPGTAYPGQRGNTVLLGHRTTHLHPFLDLDDLRRGDTIELRADGETYVYRVQDKRITMPDDRDALEPVPYRPWSPPDGAYVTLITCHPKGSDARRLIVVGRLVPAA